MQEGLVLSFGRWGKKVLFLLTALALLVALLAACRSDSGGGKPPVTAETPTPGETAASDETAASGQTPANGDSGLRDLADLASQAVAGVTAKVTYAYTTESNGQTTEQEWVMVQRPPDSRFEIHSTDGIQETRTIVIVTPDKSYTCISASGTESCLESTGDGTQALKAAFAPLFYAPQTIVGGTRDIGLVDESAREIGGLHAKCFAVDAVALGGASEFCFSDGGILLFLKGEVDGSSFTFEAKSASTDVTDADFEPPYDITEVPTG